MRVRVSKRLRVRAVVAMTSRSCVADQFGDDRSRGADRHTYVHKQAHDASYLRRSFHSEQRVARKP